MSLTHLVREHVPCTPLHAPPGAGDTRPCACTWWPESPRMPGPVKGHFAPPPDMLYVVYVCVICCYLFVLFVMCYMIWVEMVGGELVRVSLRGGQTDRLDT